MGFKRKIKSAHLPTESMNFAQNSRTISSTRRSCATNFSFTISALMAIDVSIFIFWVLSRRWRTNHLMQLPIFFSITLRLISQQPSNILTKAPVGLTCSRESSRGSYLI